jgi:hypothetical protein
MRFTIVAMGGLACLALGCCNRAPARLPSLVGATKLPAPADLHKEVIVLARVGGSDAKDLLNIEIRPNNQVIADHYRGRDKPPVAHEDLHVSAQDVERLRRMLWRLRPDDGAPAEKAIPLGCHYVDDAGEEWQIGYARRDRPAHLELFELPYAEYCRSRAYIQARQLIADTINALPHSKVIEQFPSGRFHPLGTYSP